MFLSQVVSGDSQQAPQRIELPKEAVSKNILANGLIVLTKGPYRADGLVAVDIKVMAGSSLEGEHLGTGVSHLVEHMIFKGTPSRGPGQIEKEVKSYGGMINGSVSQDLADYHIILPAGYLRKALDMLKDMLSDAAFDAKEFAKEKEVVLNELKMNLDEPESYLIRLLNETAYIRHPYRYPPIGYVGALRRLSREDALKYYKNMYVPNNMVVSIVGGSSQGDAADAAKEIFSGFGQSSYGAVGAIAAEPAQIEKRALEIGFDTNLAYVAMGFHSTSVLDEDLFAMDVLAMILGRGDNSRLSKALLKSKRLVHSINCWDYTPRDPGLFVVTAVMDKEKVGEAERSVLDEINAVKEGDIGKEELAAAKRMVVADYIFLRQDIRADADNLSADYILTGAYDFSARYVDGIEKVSAEDVKRVASKYLREENLSTVRLLPKSYMAQAIPAKQAMPQEGAIEKKTLQNGLRVLLRRNYRTPTISITAAISGGIAEETAVDNGISNLTARLLLKGTTNRSRDEIAGGIERLGGSIRSFTGFDGFGINIEILKPDLETAATLLKDILSNPTFPESELEKERSIVLAMIKEEDDDIFNHGFNQMRKELFSPSPYGYRILGEEQTVNSIKKDDIAKFYKKHFTPENVVISVSGDIETDKIFEKLKAAFSEIKISGAQEPGQVNVPKIDKARIETLNMDKEQSLVLFGFQTVSMASGDRYALDVLGAILSGSSGRLFNEMRGTRSLAYTQGCVQKLAKEAGFLVLYTATGRDEIPQVKKILLEEVARIRGSLAGDEEVAMAKRELDTNYDIETQTNLFFSQTSALDELYGLGCGNIYKYKAGIDKVTSGDVKRAAENYLNPGVCAEVVITQDNAKP